VVQIKAALIAPGMLNAGTVARSVRYALAVMAAGAPLPRRVRLGAGLSFLIWIWHLLIWGTEAACGRLIAYF